jgi:transposase, IS5 family
MSPLLTSRSIGPGGQFVTHVAALPGNPYDGHTLATVIPQLRPQIVPWSTLCRAD